MIGSSVATTGRADTGSSEMLAAIVRGYFSMSSIVTVTGSGRRKASTPESSLPSLTSPLA